MRFNQGAKGHRDTGNSTLVQISHLLLREHTAQEAQLAQHNKGTLPSPPNLPLQVPHACSGWSPQQETGEGANPTQVLKDSPRRTQHTTGLLHWPSESLSPTSLQVHREHKSLMDPAANMETLRNGANDFYVPLNEPKAARLIGNLEKQSHYTRHIVRISLSTII